MAGISTLNGSFKTTFQVQGTNAQAGAVYTGLTTNVTIPKSLTISNTIANAVIGGADEAFSFQQGIVAGGTATLSLIAMTNIMQQAAVVIARLKVMQVRVLSSGDDSTITPTPIATSTVT